LALEALSSPLHPVGTGYILVDVAASTKITSPSDNISTFPDYRFGSLPCLCKRREIACNLFKEDKCKHFSDNVLISNTFSLLIQATRHWSDYHQRSFLFFLGWSLCPLL
jgi:hypothetical protein